MLQSGLIINTIESAVGKIPVVATVLKFSDHLGAVKTRIGFGRMKYAIEPGLYAVGEPNDKSPLFVTANYKLSFDSLRKELSEFNGWILVLDTKGINVWCAAGKGAFGTDELVKRIKLTKLHQLLNHRQLIVPQLGAVGVSAHQVKELTGFKVIFGPIRAADLPAFIQAGNKATDDMRAVKFNALSRLILTPIEFIHGLKYLAIAGLIFFILSGLNSGGISFSLMLQHGPQALVSIALGFLAGIVLTPLFLPFIPTRPFALKGALITILVFVLMLIIFPDFQNESLVEKISWLLIMTAISSFFAMNFTGASTFTSLSGVKKEMKYAVPLQVVGFVVGSILWILKRFI